MRKLVSLFYHTIVFAWFKYNCFFKDEEYLIKRLSDNMSEKIKIFFSFLIKEYDHITDKEVSLMKELMFEYWTQYFYFLPKQKQKIKICTFKKVDHKINWLLKQRG